MSRIFQGGGDTLTARWSAIPPELQTKHIVKKETIFNGSALEFPSWRMFGCRDADELKSQGASAYKRSGTQKVGQL